MGIPEGEADKISGREILLAIRSEKAALISQTHPNLQLLENACVVNAI